MILVEPYGGLGNRMRTLEAAIELARISSHKLRVSWIPDDSISAKFSELFRPVPGVEILESSGPSNFREAIVSGKVLLRHFLFRVFRKLGMQFLLEKRALWECDRSVDQNEIDSANYSPEFWIDLTRQCRSIKIRSYSAFFSGGSSVCQLKPRANLIKEIEAFSLEQNLHERIGVHIRRGDKVFRDLSPAELFTEEMDKLLDRCGRGFFLASDDPETLRSMKERYGDKVVTYPKRTLARDTSVGIQDALIEMYLLSRCSQIVGTFGSSFSEMAARLGKKALNQLLPRG